MFTHTSNPYLQTIIVIYAHTILSMDSKGPTLGLVGNWRDFEINVENENKYISRTWQFSHSVSFRFRFSIHPILKCGFFLSIDNKGYGSSGGTGTGTAYGSNSGYGTNNAYGSGSLSKTYYTTRTYRPTASQKLVFPDDDGGFSNHLEMQSGSRSVENVRPVCTKKPKTIMNASVRCTLMTNTCKAVCKEGYQFPTGETLLNVICDAGEWSLEKYEWSDKLSCEREFFVTHFLSSSINFLFFFLFRSHLCARM